MCASIWVMAVNITRRAIYILRAVKIKTDKTKFHNAKQIFVHSSFFFFFIPLFVGKLQKKNLIAVVTLFESKRKKKLKIKVILVNSKKKKKARMSKMKIN